MLKRLFWFGLVGVAGFAVDAGVLYLLKDLTGLYSARALSFVAAVFATWILNRTITFKQKDSGLNKRKEFLAYLSLMLIGGAFNYFSFVLLIIYVDVVREHPIIGVAIGSILGMLVNFFTASNLYKKKV